MATVRRNIYSGYINGNNTGGYSITYTGVKMVFLQEVLILFATLGTNYTEFAYYLFNQDFIIYAFAGGLILGFIPFVLADLLNYRKS